MKTLDLHGLNHEDAHREVEMFVNDNWDAPEGSLKIITGHSISMRKQVVEVLDRYDLGYSIGGPIGIDQSFILI
jgi:DNA-nicking Smr family endonuclease